MEPSSRPLYLVCTREVVYNWLDRNPNGRPMIVRKRRWTKSWHDLRSYWVNQLLACSNNTSIPPIISPYDRGGSNIIFRGSREAYLHETYHTHMPIWSCLWNELLEQTCNTLILSKVQTCLPGSEKSESNSVRFAAPSRPSLSTYSNKTNTNINTARAKKLTQIFF